MPFDANDPETKAAFNKMLDEADARIEAMDAKVKEAVEEAKRAKAETRTLKAIDPADVAALEAQLETERAEKATAQASAKEATAAADKAAKALAAESAFIHSLLVENGLREALAANGVTNPAYQKMGAAVLAPGVKIVTVGDTRVAQYGEEPLAEYVKNWAAGEEGKHVVSAALNGGGGAPGGATGGGGKFITQAQHDAMTPKARAAHFAANGELAG